MFIQYIFSIIYTLLHSLNFLYLLFNFSFYFQKISQFFFNKKTQMFYIDQRKKVKRILQKFK